MKRTGLIAPSLAAADLGRLREEVRGLEDAGADSIHIDIMDGVFVPNLTFGPWILDVVRSVSDLPLDCHLMVSRPQDWIPIIARAGADTITIHIESAPHVHRLIDSVKKAGKRAGVSFNPGNPVCLVKELLDWVDVVQVMSVDPGFSGQSFILNTLKKMKELKDLRESRSYQIEVDGGITLENIASIQRAGADIYVLGSFIFSHPNRVAVFEELRSQLIPAGGLSKAA